MENDDDDDDFFFFCDSCIDYKSESCGDNGGNKGYNDFGGNVFCNDTDSGDKIMRTFCPSDNFSKGIRFIC